MATRYWVGGNGTWDTSSTTHWSTSSGGANGASVPDVADNVIFDANSFSANAQVVTIHSASNGCTNLNLSAVSYAVSFTLNPTLWNIRGNLVGSSNVTWTGTVAWGIQLSPSVDGVAQTLTTNGMICPTLYWAVNASGSLTLLDDLVIAAEVTTGEDPGLVIQRDSLGTGDYTGFVANGFNVTARAYAFQNNVRVRMGNGTWTLNPKYATYAVGAQTSGVVIVCGLSTLIIDLVDLVGTTFTFEEKGGNTLNNVDLYADTISATVTMTCQGTTFNSFTVYGAPVTLKFPAGQTNTFGTLNLNGSAGNLITLQSSSAGTQTNFYASTVSASYVDVKDNYAHGAAIRYDDTVGGVDSGNNTDWLFGLPTYNASLVSVVSRVNQNAPLPQFVLGGRNSSTYKLFKKTTTHSFSLYRSPVYQVGKEFDVMEIRFSVMPTLTTNMTITPVLYFDNERSHIIGTTINSTNFSSSAPGAGRLITLTPKEFSDTIHGYSNFFLELRYTGSALAVVLLPITIEIDVYD